MANSENLKTQSSSEARKNGKKGGIAAGRKRRERKALKEELLLLLSQGNTQQKISLGLLNKAIQGDVKAFEVIRDTIGEKPTDKQEIVEIQNLPKITITEWDILENPQSVIKELKNNLKWEATFLTIEGRNKVLADIEKLADTD